MRAAVCSVVLWALIVVVILPIPVMAQNQGAGGVDIRRPQSGAEAIRPGIEDLLRPLWEELQRPQGDDVRPPRGDDATRPQDDPPTVDRVAPVIRVTQREFVSRSRAATVRATITDASGVARAVIRSGGRNIRMTAVGGNVFQAEVPLAAHYRHVSATISAWDRQGNAARPVATQTRRAPGCGRAEGVSLRLVTAVQQKLAALGRYGGEIDGLAGPSTCGAITGAGIREPFRWPDVIGALDQVAEDLIALRITPPTGELGQMNVIRVTVIDPGNTGKVTSVRMLVDGRLTDAQPNSAGDLGFLLAMAEGARHQVRFQAIGGDQARVLAEAQTVLSRPVALRLSLTGEGLTDGRVESDADQVTLLADLTGARRGRVFYSEGGQVRAAQSYAGQAVRFQVRMPPPGTRAVLVFGAESGNRSAAPQRIELIHLWLAGPSVPDLAPGLAPVPQANRSALLRPRSGAQITPTATPLAPSAAAQDRAPAPIAPPPPIPAPRGWLVPVGVGLVLMLGMIAGGISVLRHGVRPPREAPQAVPTLRVVAVPDEAPVVEVNGADRPGLMLTVRPDPKGRAEMVFDDEREAVPQ